MEENFLYHILTLSFALLYSGIRVVCGVTLVVLTLRVLGVMP